MNAEEAYRTALKNNSERGTDGSDPNMNECLVDIQKSINVGFFETTCKWLSDKNRKVLVDKGYVVINNGQYVYETTVKWNKPTK